MPFFFFTLATTCYKWSPLSQAPFQLMHILLIGNADIFVYINNRNYVCWGMSLIWVHVSVLFHPVKLLNRAYHLQGKICGPWE